ncbi:hypothetical protein IEQ34_015355 [Dendrobium chrysotoxum]|uniref:peptidylprolyl isomerase n=1 Tax=Dendrobium chrysotoxum TaxID=161865 RepID=A0AAV7GHX4_DENCH|nr:hypothetical protein IEQ34_015355 [Dendrobium chrysotoxum]
MASFLISPAPFPPLPKPQYACSNSPRPPTPPSQPPPSSPSPSPSPPPLSLNPINPINPKPKSADSTDWIASTLTRRFGLGGGLAWAGFLFAGVVSEQIKTRFEASQQQSNTKEVDKEEEITLPNGISYCDIRVGGGAIPRSGDLVVINLKGKVFNGGDVFVDTFGDGKRPLALVMGSRPYSRGMCEGVEYMLRSMRAGGRRRVVVPPELGFGDEGADFGKGVRVFPGAMLEFVVEVDKVSIAPS